MSRWGESVNRGDDGDAKRTYVNFLAIVLLEVLSPGNGEGDVGTGVALPGNAVE
jgi:hypothetical protein